MIFGLTFAIKTRARLAEMTDVNVKSAM